MIHQSGLQSINLLYLCCFRVDPINHGVDGLICKCSLMLVTEAAKKKNTPIIIMVLPPIKIYVERGIY